MPCDEANQSAVSEPPDLEATDASRVARDSWSYVGSGQRPVVVGAATLSGNFIEDDPQVGERGHEGLGYLRNRATLHGSWRRHVLRTKDPGLLLPEAMCLAIIDQSWKLTRWNKGSLHSGSSPRRIFIDLRLQQKRPHGNAHR
jgi:hypothetical protein